MNKLINIGEASKLLNLINKSNKKPKNNISRYWRKNVNKLSQNLLINVGITHQVKLK